MRSFYLIFLLNCFLFADISFKKDVKPILDNRCVVCHSCYNSPCQTKFSSFEGIQRGGSKQAIYENRLKAMETTRLFIDANSSEQWREKGFYSLIEPLDEDNNSIMSMFLDQKQKFPNSKGDYSPELDDLTCSKNLKELKKYIEKKPYHGMPYGFPALSKKEHQTIIKWLKDGAKDDTDDFSNIPKVLDKFEIFLNKQDIKHQITARYIYEHLFLAHLKVKDSNSFYQLIRSYDKDGKLPVDTRLPYGKVDKKFYYKVKKIKSTIVHKTHMVYDIDEEKLNRYKELFIQTKWSKNIKAIGYQQKIAANPLDSFKQMPLKSRYQFLLDDIHYFIMTFIRGPVCKGQVALNVINDHFWIAFKNPNFDETIQNKNFLNKNLENLSLPNEYGSNTPLLKSFDIMKYDNVTVKYYENKNKLYSSKKLDINSIWKGNHPNNQINDSILTIYRHFDSASVHKGALGNLPRTMWIIDYPLLERLYYSLVAGFDVFGNTQHKVLVRKYMDRLRIEGESNFLEYLPKNSRQKIFDNWYSGFLAKYFVTYTPSSNETAVKFQTKNYKEEMIKKILEFTNTKKDEINYIEKDHQEVINLEKYKTKKEIELSLKDLTLIKNLKKYKEFSSTNFNLIYLRFKMKNKDLVYSLVINRWHDNVAFMFEEDERLDVSKDTINIIEGFIGSYPNYFVVVEEKDIPKFFKILKEYKNSEEHLKEFFISRSDKRFWKTFDWFQNRFYQDQSIKAGLFDLNRYYHKSFY